MGLLEWVFGGEKRRTPPGDEAVARAIVDRVVEATDRRLKLVRGYQTQLADAALATLEHLRSFIGTIPGPIEASAAAWPGDPVLRALFATAADVPLPFGRDESVRAYFDQTTESHCLALLGLEVNERRVLTSALRGEAIQSEVARTSVSFGPGRVLAPSAEMQALRVEIGKRAIDFLAMRALARIGEEHSRKDALESERALLKVRLQLAERQKKGLSGLRHEAEPREADPKEITRQLAENERALAQFSAHGLMDHFMEILREVLTQPAAYLPIDREAYALDAMNFRVEGDEPPSVRFETLHLKAADGNRYALFLARFHREELAARPDFGDAARYL